MRDSVEKVGVGWNRKFKKGEGIKLAIEGKIYVAYKNLAKEKLEGEVKEKAPDYIIVKYVTNSKENKKEEVKK